MVYDPCECDPDVSEDLENCLCCLGAKQPRIASDHGWHLLLVYNFMESCVNVTLSSFFFMKHTCPCCGKQGTLRCSKCNKVYYCSPVCQSRDWPSHKQVCGRQLRDYSSPVNVIQLLLFLSACLPFGSFLYSFRARRSVNI